MQNSACEFTSPQPLHIGEHTKNIYFHVAADVQQSNFSFFVISSEIGGISLTLSFQ